MQDKDILETIDRLSAYVAQAKVDIGELAGSYRALAENADAALYGAIEAHDELGKLLDAIESGEVALGEDTQRVLKDLSEMSAHVLEGNARVRWLYSDNEKAPHVISNAASIHQDVIGLSRELR